MRALSSTGDWAFVIRAIAAGTAFVGVLLVGGCKKKEGSPPDAGPRAVAPANTPSLAPDGGAGATYAHAGGSPVPGPPAAPRGPRVAAIVEVERPANLGALRRATALAATARFIEGAVKDVYGDPAFAAEVKKASGEALRLPQSLAFERLDVGPGPELWRVTYEAWCGKSTTGSAGYKSDHLLLSRTGGEWRLVASYRPGCDESGEPEVQLLDLDGDGAEDVLVSYASTRLGAENHLEQRLLRRTTLGFNAQPLLRESSPFQTLETRHLPSAGGGREVHFRTFREDPAGCNFFEVHVVYRLDRGKGAFARGPESLRAVPPKVLADEGEDVDPRCEKQ